MFGSSTNGAGPGGGNAAHRPAAAEVARIAGNLTHILVGDESAADGVSIFQNGSLVPAGSVESLSLEIIAPTDASPDGTLTAILSRYGTLPESPQQQSRPQQAVSLFPGTVELIARGRRVTLTCQQASSFDGLWLGLGLRADGTSAELTGVQSLRIVVSPADRLLDARLVWADSGIEESLLG